MITVTNTALTAAIAALRAQGKGKEADDLEASFRKEQEQKEIAQENLRRATGKKDRQARTHQPKVMPRPSEDPIYVLDYRGKTPTPEVIASLSRRGSSEMGVDCGPPRNGYRGVPQRGSHGGPAVTFADWIEQEIARTPDDLPGAADRAAGRIERKLDALMLTAKEYEQRAWRIAALLLEIERHGGNVETANAAVLRYPWPPVYDADAVGAEIVGSALALASERGNGAASTGEDASTTTAAPQDDDAAGAEPAGASTATPVASTSSDDEAEPDSDDEPDNDAAHVEDEVTSP